MLGTGASNKFLETVRMFYRVCNQFFSLSSILWMDTNPPRLKRIRKVSGASQRSTEGSLLHAHLIGRDFEEVE